MTTRSLIAAVLWALYFVSAIGWQPAAARNERANFAIAKALATAEAKGKLDPSIRFFFGRQPHTKVAQDFGEWKTNKKSNGFGKTDAAACEWAFLGAMIELQERAKKLGADAVIGIVSNYQNIESSSETEFTCGSGALISGVALKARVVKLGTR